MVRNLYLIRGLPGSGKSTFARALAPVPCVSADDYFTTDSGEYVFDPSRLSAAHLSCQDRCRRILNRDGSVVVANTFSQMWELLPYLVFAHNLGARVTVADMFDAGLSDEALAGRCVHGVPVATIAKMRARWERYVVTPSTPDTTDHG